MQPATGQAAWQIEQANAPKQASGSMTAIVLGAFLRGPLIIFVHMVSRLYIAEAARRCVRRLGTPTRAGDPLAAHPLRALPRRASRSLRKSCWPNSSQSTDSSSERPD